MSSKRRFAEHVLIPLLLAAGTVVLLALLYFLHEYGQTREPTTAQQYHLSAAQLREYIHFTGTQVALLMGLLLSLLTALWLKKRMLYTLALLLSAGYLVQLLIH
ncbi:hypothetical protein ACW9KT_11200 [Hymenobacter sp. HD11105]